VKTPFQAFAFSFNLHRYTAAAAEEAGDAVDRRSRVGLGTFGLALLG
jgi:hypothetical protein